MDTFQLDPRLEQDCIALLELSASKLLLLDNAVYPWFVLVPRTNVFEFYQLDANLQQTVLQEINQVSQFVNDTFEVDKLNVGMLGNVVKQLHIHVLGRRKDDPAWPAPVWGHSVKRSYSECERSEIKGQVAQFFAQA